METLSQVLEACMLICFGASWPLSVYKNYKARTAKSMSLPFILLIITGYICGIIAKFVGNKINYVLIVYFFNLIVVSLNVIIYIRNTRLDKKREEEEKSGK